MPAGLFRHSTARTKRQNKNSFFLLLYKKQPDHFRTRREAGRPSSSRRDPWPRKGRSPRWRRRTAAAWVTGFGRSRWWGIRKRIRFRHRIRRLRRWRHRRRWTWRLSRCPCGRKWWRERSWRPEQKPGTINLGSNDKSPQTSSHWEFVHL